MSRAYFTLAVAAALTAMSTTLVVASDTTGSDIDLESASDSQPSTSGASNITHSDKAAGADAPPSDTSGSDMELSYDIAASGSGGSARAADASRSQTRSRTPFPRYALYRRSGFPELSQDDAQAICASYGGWLATITSQADQDQLVAEIGHLDWNTYGACTAGSDHEQEGHWSWMAGPAEVIGRAISYGSKCAAGAYCNWRKGEPNDHHGWSGIGEHILAVRPVKYGFGWNDWHECNDFICEFALEKSVSKTLVPASASRSQTRSAPFSRYALYRRTGLHSVSQNDGNAICVSHGGWLATITSQADHDQLVAEIGHLDWSPYGACTAGSDSKREGLWSWMAGPAGVIGRAISYGSKCVAGAYCRWASGEPNNRYGKKSEDILAVRPARYGFRWNDQHGCNDIICEFAPGTIVPETPVPEVDSSVAPTTASATGSEASVTEMEYTAKVLPTDAATNDHNSAAKSETTPATTVVPPVPASIFTHAPKVTSTLVPKATSVADTTATPAPAAGSASQSAPEGSSSSAAEGSSSSGETKKDGSTAAQALSESPSEPTVLGREVGSAGAATDGDCIWYDWSTWTTWCWIVFVVCMIALYCILHGVGYLIARRYLGNKRQAPSTCSGNSSGADDAVDAFTSIEVKATQHEEEGDESLYGPTCEEEPNEDNHKTAAVILIENPLGAEYNHFLNRSPQEEEGLSEQTYTDEALTTNGSFSTASASFEIVAGVCQQEETAEMCGESESAE